MPDSWAIKQLFPIMPIHRLNEKPTRRAVLGDITCDSDGKIDQFIDLRDVRNTLELHPFDGQPYYLGAFLLGAYQEILGDLHNLFGDTNAVHVSLDEDGSICVEHVIKGDTVREVLDYVQYSADELIAACARTSSGPSAPARSRSTNRGSSCTSTSRGWKGTPTWKSRELMSASGVASAPRVRLCAVLCSSFTGADATPLAKYRKRASSPGAPSPLAAARRRAIRSSKPSCRCAPPEATR